MEPWLSVRYIPEETGEVLQHCSSCTEFCPAQHSTARRMQGRQAAACPVCTVLKPCTVSLFPFSSVLDHEILRAFAPLPAFPDSRCCRGLRRVVALGSSSGCARWGPAPCTQCAAGRSGGCLLPGAPTAAAPGCSLQHIKMEKKSFCRFRCQVLLFQGQALACGRHRAASWRSMSKILWPRGHVPKRFPLAPLSGSGPTAYQGVDVH